MKSTNAWCSRIRLQPPSLAIAQGDDAERSPHSALAVPSTSQHDFEIERGPADHLQHIGGGDLLLSDFRSGRRCVHAFLSRRVFSIAITA